VTPAEQVAETQRIRRSHARLKLQLLRAEADRHEIAIEIADETAAREWVPVGLIKDYEQASARADNLRDTLERTG
jgi:hypothetical protein